MPTYTYMPRYKISTKPLAPGQRVLFKRGKYKGRVRTLVDKSWPGAFITSNGNGGDHIQHLCGTSLAITDIIVPLKGI